MLELIVNISFVKCFFLFSGIKYTFYSYVQGTSGYFSHQIILMLMESGKQKFPPLITFLPDHFAISKYEGRVSWGLLILSFSWISLNTLYLLLSLFNRVFFYGDMFSLSLLSSPLLPPFYTRLFVTHTSTSPECKNNNVCSLQRRLQRIFFSFLCFSLSLYMSVANLIISSSLLHFILK